MPDYSTPHYSTTSDVESFVALVHRFATERVDADTFEVDFLDLHRNHHGYFPPGMYPVMQDLFYAVEDYVKLDHLRDPGELDADQFRARVTELEPELLARFEAARRREDDVATGGR